MAVLQLLVGVLAVSPMPPPSADSVALQREARDAQVRFERMRVHHAPLSWWSSGGRCDEVVGRFCLRFSSDDRNPEAPPWQPPEEAPAVGEARDELLEVLVRVFSAHPGDGWVAGQLVAYLGEAEKWDEAGEVARACRAVRPGWCLALEGYALHGAGRSREAEAVFRRALEALPPEEREDWLELEWLVEIEIWRELRRLEPEDRQRLEERIWELGNPLFLTGANELFVEHLSRQTLAQIWDGARNPYGIRWGSDMTQLLVRYGSEVAYERVRDPPAMHMGPPPVVGRFPPGIRGILPELEALSRPTVAGPEAFPTHRRRARSRHAAGVADRVRDLDTQLARFRRGDSLLVVAAWALPERPPPPPDSTVAWGMGGSVVAADPAAPADPEVAMFLLDAGRAPGFRFDGDGTGRSGVVTARVPTDGYLLSLEVVETEAREAWRHRRGVHLDPRHPEVVELSDLLLLEPEADAAGPHEGEGSDEPLEAHLDRALPSRHLDLGPVEVAWEVYGIPEGDGILRFRLSAEREERGIFRRAGEALRLLSPPSPVEVSWEEGIPSGHVRHRALFRRVEMELTGLEPGSYRLRLSLALPGRTAATSERSIEIRER